MSFLDYVSARLESKKVCLSANLWSVFGYEFAKMNPDFQLCIHDAEKPDCKKLEIHATYVIHHPDVAGKTPEEIIQYFEAFYQRTGISLLDIVK